MFCAIVELVGIRELAEDAPRQYREATRTLRRCLEVATCRYPDHDLYAFRDQCYVQAKDLAGVCEFLAMLRRQLWADGQFVRSVLGPDDVGVEVASLPSSRTATSSATRVAYFFNERAAELYGLMERLKSVGIQVHPELLRKPHGRAEAASLPGTDLVPTVHSYYCTSYRGRSRSYRHFVDLAYSVELRTDESLALLMTRITSDNQGSGRMGRFYVPCLLNWVRTAALDGDEADSILGILNALTARAYRDIPGVELVVLATIDELYAGRQTEDRTCALCEVMGQSDALGRFTKRATTDPWVLSLLARDHPNAAVHDTILSRDSRRRFLDAARRAEQDSAGRRH